MGPAAGAFVAGRCFNLIGAFFTFRMERGDSYALQKDEYDTRTDTHTDGENEAGLHSEGSKSSYGAL